MRIEDRFKELDGIVNELESGEISLEESFELYKKGMDMLKECNKDIDKVEKQIIVLQSSEDSEEE
jgi:exodeoxyribonuclease VII small subunit